jgi:hypothetical protein
MGSPLSCIILLRATLATLGFSSLTASARMALSKFSSVNSSRGMGPTQFRVTSRLSFASHHSSSCMVVLSVVKWTACEYDLKRVTKYYHPSVVPPEGRLTGAGFALTTLLWIMAWVERREPLLLLLGPSHRSGETAVGMSWVGINCSITENCFSGSQVSLYW